MDTTPASASTPVLQHLDALLPKLEALYKDVHAYPELSMQETRTAGLAAEGLSASGFEVTTGVGKTGVAGVLRNGDGPTVMLRADMDALPVKEATGLPYASTVTATGPEGDTVPVMHACGRRQPADPAVRARRARIDAAGQHRPGGDGGIGGDAPADDRVARSGCGGIRGGHRRRAAGWPVIHPTLETHIEALVVASHAWLAA
jgi:hypothetical protein